jgi:sugar phosphate isomerase/epimerase
MKFGFSTVSCPAWDFETIVARAAEYGYDGVEIRAFSNESVGNNEGDRHLHHKLR